MQKVRGAKGSLTALDSAKSGGNTRPHFLFTLKMPKIVPVKGGRPVGRSRKYSASRTRSYYKQYMRPAGGVRVGYGAVSRTAGAAVIGEMKYFDCEKVSTALAAVTTTWVATTLVDPSTTINLGDAAVATPGCLFAPKVSAALNGRIGRKVFVHSIKVKGQINVPVQAAQATADSATPIRILLVMDKQSNAGAMTSAQLLNDAGEARTTLESFQNPNNFGRFKVLKDKQFTLTNINMTGSPTTGDIVQSGMAFPFKMSYKFKKPLVVNFNATNGGTIADIIDNSFHMVAGVSSSALAGQITYYSRVCYKE